MVDKQIVNMNHDVKSKDEWMGMILGNIKGSKLDPCGGIGGWEWGVGEIKGRRGGEIELWGGGSLGVVVPKNVPRWGLAGLAGKQGNEAQG